MSELAVAAVGIVLIAAINLYWWRRERTVRDGLRLSRQRALTGSSETQRVGNESKATLQEAARVADVGVEDLPDRIEALDDEVRELNNEVDSLREAWAASWWDALARDPVDAETPHVMVVPLTDGDVDIVQTFAQVAVDQNTSITIVLGLDDGSCSVTVGSDLRDEFSAVAILDEVTDRAGGGGGGSESFATGGGADPDALQSAVDAVTVALEERI